MESTLTIDESSTRQDLADRARVAARPEAREHLLERLLNDTEFVKVELWQSDGGGTPILSQAVPSPMSNHRLEAELFERARSLPGAAGIDELGELAPRLRPDGLRGLAPLASGNELLVVYGPEDLTPRPRDLATLADVAERLDREKPDPEGPAPTRLSPSGDLDDELCRLDRLAALGSLVAEIAHEIRNPLVSIKTLLELLPEQGNDPEFLESFVPVALDEVRRVERLLEALLSHARPVEESIGASVPDAIASVARLLHLRAREAQVLLEVRCPEELPAVGLGDDGLRQVLLNLAVNALDASPKNGAVVLSARPVGDSLCVSVSDEGPGIPEELRSRVFEPFFSTKSGRSGGLGLAISHRLVSEAGGQLRAEEAEGGGARFELLFPLADAPTR